MPAKVTDERPPLRLVREFDGGFSWIAHPEEGMRRASHALASDDDVWVVDPVDADGLDDRLSDLGDVVGVVVLLNRHTRDAGPVASRHDVPVYVPTWMSGVESAVDAPVETVVDGLGGTGYEVHRLLDTPVWQEALLAHDERSVLVVPEAVGTAPFFRATGERVGVHPVLRLTPPRKLATWTPDHLLVGHGEPLHENVTAALRDALDNARRRAPKVVVHALTSLLR